MNQPDTTAASVRPATFCRTGWCPCAMASAWPRTSTCRRVPSRHRCAAAVILERTPYDKSGISRAEKIGDRTGVPRPEVARYFADQGFAVVYQDCRGRYASEGHFTKYLAEGPDGFDTLAWILAQPWCNGRSGPWACPTPPTRRWRSPA